jgi:hypothetical protein
MVQKYAAGYDQCGSNLNKFAEPGIVSIMDTIMFDAHRQGRVSFYMVSSSVLENIDLLTPP